MNKICRRSFLSSALSAIALPAWALPRAPSVRALEFYNLHTGETLSAEYWADGAYVPGALAEIDGLLRDFRTGERHPIDRSLLDLLHDLHTRLETQAPFHVISGYRSPHTNQMLRESSAGVAGHSLHMAGEAIDIRVPGRDLRQVRDAALSLGAGGVGFYPASDFVHVDVVRVRRW